MAQKGCTSDFSKEDNTATNDGPSAGPILPDPASARAEDHPLRSIHYASLTSASALQLQLLSEQTLVSSLMPRTMGLRSTCPCRAAALPQLDAVQPQRQEICIVPCPPKASYLLQRCTRPSPIIASSGQSCCPEICIHLLKHEAHIPLGCHVNGLAQGQNIRR